MGRSFPLCLSQLFSAFPPFFASYFCSLSVVWLLRRLHPTGTHTHARQVKRPKWITSCRSDNGELNALKAVRHLIITSQRQKSQTHTLCVLKPYLPKEKHIQEICKIAPDPGSAKEIFHVDIICFFFLFFSSRNISSIWNCWWIPVNYGWTCCNKFSPWSACVCAVCVCVCDILG